MVTVIAALYWAHVECTARPCRFIISNSHSNLAYRNNSSQLHVKKWIGGLVTFLSSWQRLGFSTQFGLTSKSILFLWASVAPPNSRGSIHIIVLVPSAPAVVQHATVLFLLCPAVSSGASLLCLFSIRSSMNDWVCEIILKWIIIYPALDVFTIYLVLIYCISKFLFLYSVKNHIMSLSLIPGEPWSGSEVAL